MRNLHRAQWGRAQWECRTSAAGRDELGSAELGGGRPGLTVMRKAMSN